MERRKSVPSFDGPDAQDVLLPLLNKIPGVRLRSLWDLARRRELPVAAIRLVVKFTGHTSNQKLIRVMSRCLGTCIPIDALGPAERSLVATLRKAGLRITSTQDLAHLRSVPRRLLPLLVQYLRTNDPESSRDGVVRVVGRSIRGSETDPRRLLFREFRRARGDDYRWAVGLALFDSARPWMVEDYLALIRDPRYSRSGMQALQMVLMALGKLRATESIPGLRRLLRNPSLCQAAVLALGKMRDPSLIQVLEPLLRDPDSEFLQHVRTAIGRLRRAHRESSSNRRPGPRSGGIGRGCPGRPARRRPDR